MHLTSESSSMVVAFSAYDIRSCYFRFTMFKKGGVENMICIDNVSPQEILSLSEALKDLHDKLVLAIEQGNTEVAHA